MRKGWVLELICLFGKLVICVVGYVYRGACFEMIRSWSRSEVFRFESESELGVF